MRLHQRDGLLGIGRIEGNGEIAILRHLLRVQSGGLLLHCTEWTADGNGGQLSHCILRCVQIRRQRDAVAIVKGHFFVVTLVAFGEHLVPVLNSAFHLLFSLRSLFVVART